MIARTPWIVGLILLVAACSAATPTPAPSPSPFISQLPPARLVVGQSYALRMELPCGTGTELFLNGSPWVFEDVRADGRMQNISGSLTLSSRDLAFLSFGGRIYRLLRVTTTASVIPCV